LWSNDAAQYEISPADYKLALFVSLQQQIAQSLWHRSVVDLDCLHDTWHVV